jgi:hypothetical protein
MRSRIVAGASVLLIVLAACGSASPSGEAGSSAAATNGNGGGGPPGTDLTACELVTAADIESALNLVPGTAAAGDTRDVEGDDPAANECSYLAQTWGGLVVIVSPTNGAADFESVVAAAGDDAESLDIGDGALWLPTAERGYFLKGTVLIIIQFIRLVEPVPFREPTIELGEAALAKL